MNRSKQSTFEDLIELSSKLPWWLSVIFGFLSYLIIHQFADITPPEQLAENEQMGQYAVKQLYKTLAYFFQYVIPAAFIFGAVVSVIKNYNPIRKDISTDEIAPSKLTKIIVNKIHGGRKQDSKFWKSEFEKSDTKNCEKQLPKQKRNIEGYAFLLLSVLALAIVAYIGNYIYKQNFKNNTLFARTEQPKAVQKINYPKPKYQHADNSRDRTITQKELDKAISRALRKRDIKENRRKKSKSSLHYYEIKLKDGIVIEAKSIIKEGNFYKIEDVSGLTFSLRSSEIVGLASIQL